MFRLFVHSLGHCSCQNTIEQGLARQAWWEVKAIERLHQRSCPQSTLKHIHTVLSPNQSADVSQPTSPTPQPAPASVITNFQPPLPTRLYATLFRQASMPHLPLALPATSTPSESTRVDASTGLVYHGVRELGSELWTVERCSVEQQYLVAYYGDGDAFYASVYPVNWSGAFDCMRIKAKRWLGWS